MNNYWIIICVGAFLVFVLVLGRVLSWKAAERTDSGDGGNTDEENAQAEPEAVRAVLVNKQCDVGDFTKVYLARFSEEYVLFFSTDTGDEKYFFVTEEQYKSADVGESGLLVYVGETFLAFDTDPFSADSDKT